MTHGLFNIFPSAFQTRVHFQKVNQTNILGDLDKWNYNGIKHHMKDPLK